MGIGGHMLGEKKLRQLAAKTGLPLDRAYIRGRYSEGRIIVDGRCEHYEIDPKTGSWELLTPDPFIGHWSSCPR